MEKIFNISVLGKIPLFNTNSPEEVYKNILDNFISINKNKKISIISFFISEGKSTTLFYLAKILAENKKVALINADAKSSKTTIQKLRRDIQTKINFYTTEFESLSEILNKNEEKYNYIFIDSPPILEYAKPFKILELVDSFIFLTTKKNYSNDFLNSVDKNIKDKIIGVIINKI